MSLLSQHLPTFVPQFPNAMQPYCTTKSFLYPSFRHICSFLIAACHIATTATAQNSPNDSLTTVALNTVQIIAIQNKYFAAEQSIDSTLLKQFQQDNLSTFLQQHSALYLKNYGANGLASVALRGMSASHTAVVWNDMPLNSSMNAISDLNNIPIATANQINLQYGISSLATQSGAIGGAILLQQKPVFEQRKTANIYQQIGSFGNYQSQVALTIGNKKQQYQVYFQRNQAENDYPYRNPYQANTPLTRLSPEHFRQYHVLANAFFALPKQQQIHLQTWTTQSRRQLQPPISSLNYHEQQTDQANRALLTWQQQKKHLLWQQKTGVAYSQLRYQNDTIQVESNNKTRLLFYQNKLHYQNRHLIWTANIQYQQQQINTNNYASSPTIQNKLSIYGQGQYHWKKHWTIQLQYRHEANSQQTPLILPAFALNYSPTTNWTCWGHIGKNARVPSLNDLYWQPGGNPNLRPETALMQEIGTRYNSNNPNTAWTLQAAAYHNYLHNQIAWLPSSTNSLIWSPQNIKAVRVLGGNILLKFSQQWKIYRLQSHLDYQFTTATNQIAISPSDNSVGKQLPYTPKNQLNWSIQLQRKGGYSCSLDHQFVGQRYTTSDENSSNALAPYWLSHLHLQKEWLIKTSQLQLHLSCLNLWNTTFYSLAARPMPLRHWRLSLKISW